MRTPTKEENQNISVKKMQRDTMRDTIILTEFIETFCSNNHSEKAKSHIQVKGRINEFLKDASIRLCSDCNKLLLHAVSKRIMCPYDPKPRCKKCLTHCYSTGYRERIREVMRFSGAYLLKRGGLGLAIKYFS